MSEGVFCTLVSTGMGLKVPYTGLGANVIQGFYIQVDYLGKKTLYGVATMFNVDQGGLVFYGIATDAFQVKYDFTKNVKPHSMDGRLVDLNIDAGIVLGPFGSVDVKLTVYDNLNSPLLTVERVGVEADGVMLTDAKIRGTLVKLGSNDKSGAAGG